MTGLKEKSEAYLLIGDVKHRLNFGNNEELEVHQKLNQPSTFKATLNLKNLVQFNYNDDTKIIIEKNGKEDTIFNGKIILSKKLEDSIVLRGADPLEMMKEELLSAEFIQFPAQDIVYHVAESSGLKPVVHACFFDGKIMDFKMIIPIKNLNLNNYKFSFSDVKLTKNLNHGINKMISKSEFKKEFIADNISFAEIKLQAIDFIDAHRKAIEKVTKVIDWLSYVKNFSLSSFEDQRIEWDLKRSQSLPQLTTWFYGEIDNTNYKLIMDSDFKKVSKTLSVYADKKDFLELYRDKFETIYAKNEKDLTNALHWFRRAKEYGDFKDKVLDYFTCIEFLVNKQKTPKLFPRYLRKEIFKLTEPILNGEHQQRFEDYVSQINSPSFKMRLDTFIKENKANLSDTEKENLETMRKKRCLIEHGKTDTEVYEDELRILGNVVEKIILSKLITSS